MPRRTTLTIDDDVARKLAEEARKSGRPFRSVVNDALRRGLNPPRTPARRKPFRIRPKQMLLRAGLSLDSIEQLLDQVDGSSRR